MNPIRILQVVTVMNRGGLETMLMNYYRQLNRKDIQFDFMVHREQEGHYDQEIENLGGRIFRMLPIRPGNYRSYFKQLNQFFKEHPYYQIVHAHINENSAFILRAAKKANIPHRIAHSHLSDLQLDFKYPFRLYARKVLENQPTDYFACSKKAGRWLFSKKDHTLEKMKVLHNAINIEHFQYNTRKRDQIRKQHGLKGKFVIGHVGRFNKQKNHSFILEIFKELLNEHPQSVLVLIGDGNLREKIEKKAIAIGLLPHIRFLGVCENISDMMQGFDVFLFPSLYEGLPVALVEAQAAGLTCFVSDRVTKEANITGALKFLSLEERAKSWANYMVRANHERLETTQLLKEKGYDSNTMAKWLSQYYMTKSRKALNDS
ncbi:glycosyltransferase family 1 protein [Alkalihalobacillus trypoxylicola]|uniref:Glycosyl transferase family 1 n=1 Tax=Alkalihalobacillus trypoxylicola TaxID=519424 RepID=A0A161P8I4_9BACI|nr:glycosyltransferase family 1 protein [Alkalihalobacillus trypoxylicola]KYG27663.1 glycosyl transferase family 1 [Alkalihalobacillus trypoxylicola]